MPFKHCKYAYVHQNMFLSLYSITNAWIGHPRYKRGRDGDAFDRLLYLWSSVLVLFWLGTNL